MSAAQSAQAPNAAGAKSEDEVYDRQIRLWGPHGQAAISAAHLYVLGSDCQATELLKTLVLHGVQHVTIVDDAEVTPDDISTNFFTDLDSTGPRAVVTAALLRELNPSCTITPVVQSPSAWRGFSDVPSGSVVITTGNRTVAELTDISQAIRGRAKQAHVQTAGFFGAFYLDGGLHTAIEGASIAPVPPGQLRILDPWPELQAYFDSFDFDGLEVDAHSHIPFPILLNRCLKEVCAEQGVPASQVRDADLIAKLNSWRRRKPDPEPGESEWIPNEGIDEAILNNVLARGTPVTPQEPLAVFAMLDRIDSTEPFWQLARAARNFYQRHKCLPHYGGLPDMDAVTAWYREIKGVYKAKSAADLAEMLADRDAVPDPSAIDPEFAERFIANVWRIGAVSYERLPVYLEKLPPTFNIFGLHGFNERVCVQAIFIAVRHFLAKHGRNPADTEDDRAELTAEVISLGAPAEDAPKFVQEFCRYNGTVLPSVVASFAAVLAGEVTKLIIQQGAPASGIVIYDGLHGVLHAMGPFD